MKYAFYPGCSYKAAAGYRESVEAVCRAAGIELVELPDWNCCGATTFLSLDHDQAAALVARNLALAEKQGVDQVVVICNACYTTLRKGQKILEEQPELRAEINRRLAPEGLSTQKSIKVRHLLEVFMGDLPASFWKEKGGQGLMDRKAAGYYGCQLTRPWADVDDPERPEILEKFLSRLGLTAVDHAAKTLCCGAALAPVHQAECRPVIDRIPRAARAKGADYIVTLCPLCQFNLDAHQRRLGGSGLPVLFFTQAAGLAMGLPPDRLGLDKLLVSPQGLV